MTVLHGYGEIGAIDTASRTSPLAPDQSPTNKRTNNIWVQWGFDLACKMESFPSNDTLCWNALVELAKCSQYQLHFSPSGKLRFLKRKFTLGKLASSLPMEGPITEIDLLDASGFPDASALNGLWGYVLVQVGQPNYELFRYLDKVGNTLVGVQRAQDLTPATSHTTNDTVMRIDHRAYNHPKLDNIIDIQPLQPDYKNIYNHIRVLYGGGSPLNSAGHEGIVDKDVAGDSSSPASEVLFGDKFLEIQNNLLGNHDRGWSEIIGRDYYQFYANLAHEFVMVLRFRPEIEVGNTILVDFKERALFTYQPAFVLRVTHDFTRKETVLLCRTYTELSLS